MAGWRLAGIAVVLGASALFLVRLGDRSVVSEEVRWAEIAREMRQSGDFLRPTINGRTYYDKPIGSYWLIVAASYLTGGVNETAARLPSAIAGIIGVWVVILLGRRQFDERSAVYAGAILATSLGFTFYARRATADIETVTGVLIAVWWYARHEDSPAGPWVVALWVWMAAVSLTKGLLGFVLPLIVLTVYGAWTTWALRDNQSEDRSWWSSFVANNQWLFNRWSYLAIPIGVITYMFPFLAAAARTQDAVGLEMVWRENIQRFVSPQNHTAPIYLYVGVIFVLAAPWSVFVPAALLPRAMAANSGDRLIRAYFWAIFMFFTASASRRSYYLLPVLPAASLLVGRLLSSSQRDLTSIAGRMRRAGWVVLGIGVLVSGIALAPPAWYLPAPYDRLPPLPYSGWLLAAWLSVIAALLIHARWRRGAPVGLALFTAYAAFGYGLGVLYPATDELRPRHEFLNAVRAQTDSAPNSLGLFGARETVYELGRTVPEFTTAEKLSEAVASGQIRWVIVSRRHLDGIHLPSTILLKEAILPWESRERLDNKLVLLSVRQKDRGANGGEKP